MGEVREYKYLSDLANCNIYMGFIRVRILHKHAYPDSSIDMIFIDKKGTTINAKISTLNVNKFKGNLEQGQIYDIVRFGMKTADKGSRPTRHKKLLWMNPGTRAELIPEITNFPSKRKFNFTPLEAAVKLLERKDSTFLHDLMGVVIAWTDPVIYDVHKIKREVTIQDTTGATVKVTLWNKFAEDFEDLNVSDKSVFVVTSASMNIFNNVAQGFNTTRFSSIAVDVNHQQTFELKKSDKYEPIQAGVKLEDWRDNDKITLAAIYKVLNEDNLEHRYTTIGKIAHDETFVYKACSECNTKFPEGEVTSYCKKCERKVSTHLNCRSRIDFSDSTATESLTLFGNQLETVLKMKVAKIIDAYKNNTLSEAFTAIKNDSFVVLLKPNVGGGTIYLSVSKIRKCVAPLDEVVDDYLQTEDLLEDESGYSDCAEDNSITNSSEKDDETNLSPATSMKSKSLKTNTLSLQATGTNQRTSTRKTGTTDVAFEICSNDTNNSVVAQPETPNKLTTKRKIDQSGNGGRKNAKTTARQLLAATKLNAEPSTNGNDEDIGSESIFDTSEE